MASNKEHVALHRFRKKHKLTAIDVPIEQVKPLIKISISMDPSMSPEKKKYLKQQAKEIK